jgi:C1A family cysteine protease
LKKTRPVSFHGWADDSPACRSQALGLRAYGIWRLILPQAAEERQSVMNILIRPCRQRHSRRRLRFRVGGRDTLTNKQAYRIACLVALVVNGSVVHAAMFDWRNVDGQDFTTPVRNQVGANACWAFATVAALEAKFEINRHQPDLDLDLSEQHLISDGCCGNVHRGGWEMDALNFLVSDGITDEATLRYMGRNASPDWPLTGTHLLFQATNVDTFIDGGYSTANIKNVLREEGPLVAAVSAAHDWFTPPDLAPLGYENPLGTDPSYVDPLGGTNHAVAVVGYVDDGDVDTGGYWIVKNSWGTRWGDDGYGYVKYGVLEKHIRIHAITGTTLMAMSVPEPPTASLLLLGGIALGACRLTSFRLTWWGSKNICSVCALWLWQLPQARGWC